MTKLYKTLAISAALLAALQPLGAKAIGPETPTPLKFNYRYYALGGLFATAAIAVAAAIYYYNKKTVLQPEPEPAPSQAMPEDLFKAVRDGNVKKLEREMQKTGFDIYAIYGYKRTILSYVIKYASHKNKMVSYVLKEIDPERIRPIDLQKLRNYAIETLSAKFKGLNVVDWLVEHNDAIIISALNMLATKEKQKIFFRAAERNCPNIVNLMLKENTIDIPVDLQSSHEKQTALHIAADRGNLEVVKMLLKNRASTTIKDENNLTAFHKAAWGGLKLHGVKAHSKKIMARRRNFEIVTCLAENITNIDEPGGAYNKTALHFAAQRGSIETVKYLLEKGANINATDSRGYNIIRIAQDEWSKCSVGLTRGEVIYLLLNHKDFDLTKLNTQQKTELLEQAITKKHFKIAKFLFDKKTDITALSKKNKQTLFFLAAENGCPEIVKMLLKTNDIDIDGLEGVNELTALHLAAKQGHTAIIEILLTHGANKNTSALFYFGTPLHMAAEYGQLNAVKLLVQHGANINIAASKIANLGPGYQKLTARDLALRKHYAHIVHYLELAQDFYQVQNNSVKFDDFARLKLLSRQDILDVCGLIHLCTPAFSEQFFNWLQANTTMNTDKTKKITWLESVGPTAWKSCRTMFVDIFTNPLFIKAHPYSVAHWLPYCFPLPNKEAVELLNKHMNELKKTYGDTPEIDKLNKKYNELMQQHHQNISNFAPTKSQKSSGFQLPNFGDFKIIFKQ